MEYIFAIALFAISSSVTPGPNNFLLLSSGVNFGIRRSLPLMFGICFGFTLMLFLVGTGLGEIFNRAPALHWILKVLSVLYLLYLAWRVSGAGAVDSQSVSSPLSFVNGALFQWINAKAWVIAVGAVAAFTSIHQDTFNQVLIICGVFFLMSFPCVGVWLWCGSLLKRWLNSRTKRQLFNKLMAALLMVSVLPAIFELYVAFT